MGCEFLSRHLFGRGGSGSGSGGGRLRGSSLPLLLRAITTEVSLLPASEAQPLSHQLLLFFFRHCFEDFSDNIHVHGVIVLLLPEAPARLSFVLLWGVSLDNPLDLVIIVIDLKGLLIPIFQSLRNVVAIQNLLQQGDLDGLLKIDRKSVV